MGHRRTTRQRSIEREFEDMVRAFRAQDELLAPLLAFHLLAEDLLTRIAERWLPEADALKQCQFTFHQRLCVVASLGALPSPTISALQAMNALRNKLAHRKGFQPTFDDIFAIGRPFESELHAMRDQHLDHAHEDVFADKHRLFFAIAQHIHVDLNAALHVLRPKRLPRSATPGSRP